MYRNLDLGTLENEIWKDIEGYEGMYQISNLGRVKSISGYRVDKLNRRYKLPIKIMKQAFTSTGYLMINFRKKYYKVHRLVAYAFIIKDKTRDIINHKDFNPLNNKVGNLEWCTQKENVQHAIRNKRNKSFTYCNKQKVIDLYCKGVTCTQIAKEMNITQAIASNIIANTKINRKQYPRKSKYNITIEQLKKMFKDGYTNKTISLLYNIPTEYIARRKYQFNKGEI